KWSVRGAWEHGAHLVHAGLIERAGVEALAPAAGRLYEGELCGDTGLVWAVKESCEGTSALHGKLHELFHEGQAAAPDRRTGRSTHRPRALPVSRRNPFSFGCPASSHRSL